VQLYPTGADRDQLDPSWTPCVAGYNADLDEDQQVDFNQDFHFGFLSSLKYASKPVARTPSLKFH
jgi:hypothetical protein